MKHTDVAKWLVIAVIAMIVLIGLAFSIQKPELVKNVPFIGPSATPTPLSSANIVLTSPHMNQHVSKQFRIEGKARVFENVVSIRLKNKLTGVVYGQTSTMTDASEAGQFGEFQTGVILNDGSLKTGTELVLEVFQASAKDGSDMDKIAVPLVFSPSAE